MRIGIIAVPYHLGQENVGLGAGPTRWLEAGLVDALRSAGHDVDLRVVRRRGPFTTEPEAIEAVNGALAIAVGEVVETDGFPLVLAGNCNSSMGTLGGLPEERPGVVWFDAHGDFNTPESSPTGFFDGMPIAIATGACHAGLWERVAARPPLREEDIVLAGVRDLDPDERVRVEGSSLHVVPASAIRREGVESALAGPLEALRSRTSDLYLHVDVDVLDPEVARFNELQAAEGLSLEDLVRAIRRIAGRFRVRAAALTAYDPAADPDGHGAGVGIEIARLIAQVVGQDETGP